MNGPKLLWIECCKSWLTGLRVLLWDSVKLSIASIAKQLSTVNGFGIFMKAWTQCTVWTQIAVDSLHGNNIGFETAFFPLSFRILSRSSALECSSTCTAFCLGVRNAIGTFTNTYKSGAQDFGTAKTARHFSKTTRQKWRAIFLKCRVFLLDIPIEHRWSESFGCVLCRLYENRLADQKKSAKRHAKNLPNKIGKSTVKGHSISRKCWTEQ